MKFKKLLSTVMAMAIVSTIGANAFALDKSVTVYKNIANNEFYTGTNVTPLTLANTSRKYYSGQAKIKVIGIPHGDKHIDLEINN